MRDYHFLGYESLIFTFSRFHGAICFDTSVDISKGYSRERCTVNWDHVVDKMALQFNYGPRLNRKLCWLVHELILERIRDQASLRILPAERNTRGRATKRVETSWFPLSFLVYTWLSSRSSVVQSLSVWEGIHSRLFYAPILACHRRLTLNSSVPPTSSDLTRA